MSDDFEHLQRVHEATDRQLAAQRPNLLGLQAERHLSDGTPLEPLHHREFPMPTGQEVRMTDEKTGGEKGVKLARFDLIPWAIIKEVAEHFGRGARKYADRNWERGYNWSYSFGALHRHLEAFWEGEEWDDDPSLLDPDGVVRSRHIIAVVWHGLVLAWFSRHRMGNDDRPHKFYALHDVTTDPEEVKV